MAKQRNIVDYYDDLATSYDEKRFGNSYGRFIDLRERSILKRFLPQNTLNIVDIACGTGRLMGEGTIGIDASPRSLVIAARNKPGSSFICADAQQLPCISNSFDAAMSFHFLMHMDTFEIRNVFSEVARILKPGGVFVADIVSALRRRLRSNRQSGWHAATALSRSEFRDIGATAGMRLTDISGIMLTPVHRIPPRIRQYFHVLDEKLSMMAPELSSYLVGRFVKE